MKSNTLNKRWQLDFHLSLSLADHKKTQSKLRPTSLYISFPQTISLRQKLVEFKFNAPAREVTDDIGNSWLLIEVPTTSSRFVFRYQAILETYSVAYDFSAFSAQKFPASTRFLRAETGIEIVPEIRTLADRVNSSNPLETIQNAIHAVHNHLTYKIQKSEYGAEHAILNAEGDCTEFAALLVAVLRCCRIGSRITVGYLGNEELHAIAEVYLDGIWVPIDITNISEPFLGLAKDFVTVMRANWMSKGGGEKLVTFYYQTDERYRPRLRSSTKLQPLETPRVQVIGEPAKAPKKRRKKWPLDYKLPASTTKEQIKIKLTIQEENHTVFNHNSWQRTLKATVILVGNGWIWKALPLLIEAQKTWQYSYSLDKHLLQYGKSLRWLIINSDESMVGECLLTHTVKPKVKFVE